MPRITWRAERRPMTRRNLADVRFSFSKLGFTTGCHGCAQNAALIHVAFCGNHAAMTVQGRPLVKSGWRWYFKLLSIFFRAAASMKTKVVCCVSKELQRGNPALGIFCWAVSDLQQPLGNRSLYQRGSVMSSHQ